MLLEPFSHLNPGINDNSASGTEIARLLGPEIKTPRARLLLRALGPCAWEAEEGSPGKEDGLTLISNGEWPVLGKAGCFALGIVSSIIYGRAYNC